MFTALEKSPETLTPDSPVDDAVRFLSMPPQPLPEGWWLWPNVQCAQQKLADAAIGATPKFPDGCHGRGIVICGGGRYFASTYVTLRVLRHIGCSLPVEVWHLAGEMDDSARCLLADLGAECVDADAITRTHPYRFLHGHWWKGWQLKPYAILHSRFREILLLDADCYPVYDPTFLFTWRGYQECGSIFWTSCAEPQAGLAPEQWEAFGLQPQPDSAFESGQLVIDKVACWRKLNLTVHYNAHADYTYRHVLGDKDTFLIAWRRLGRHYGQMWPICGQEGPAVLQYDDQGQVLFLHRALGKFTLGTSRFDSTRQRLPANSYFPTLPHEDFAFAALEQLGASWCKS